MLVVVAEGSLRLFSVEIELTGHVLQGPVVPVYEFSNLENLDSRPFDSRFPVEDVRCLDEPSYSSPGTCARYCIRFRTCE